MSDRKKPESEWYKDKMPCTECHKYKQVINGQEYEEICGSCQSSGWIKDPNYVETEEHKQERLFTQKLEEHGFTIEDLDGAVHEVVSRMGTKINSGGLDAQKQFLASQGYDSEDIVDLLCSL